MNEQATRRIDWSAVPLVFIPVVRPTCPHCGSQRLTIVRSEKGGDGSVSRKCVCNRCSKPLLVVVEPTEPPEPVASFWQA